MKVIVLENYEFYLIEDEDYREHFTTQIMGIDTSINFLEKMLGKTFSKNMRCILYLDRDRYIKFLNNKLEYDGYKVIIYDVEFDLDEDDLRLFLENQ